MGKLLRRFTTVCWGMNGFAYLLLKDRKGNFREPPWYDEVSVTVANRIICFFRGHDRTLESIPEAWDTPNGKFHCVNCCTTLQANDLMLLLKRNEDNQNA